MLLSVVFSACVLLLCSAFLPRLAFSVFCMAREKNRSPTHTYKCLLLHFFFIICWFMSAGYQALTESTFDEDAEFLFNPSPTPHARELPCYALTEAAIQEEGGRHLRASTQSAAMRVGMLTDTMTMGHAVRVPHALQSATRRTMLDILRYPKSTEIEVTESCSYEPATASWHFSHDKVSKHDLRRSLRHLLPSRNDAVGVVERQHQQKVEPTGEEDYSISDFDDDDDNDNDKGEQKQRKGNVDEMRRIPWPRPAEVKQHSAPQLAWAKLFDCGDPYEEISIPGGNHCIAPCGSMNSSRGCLTSVHNLCEDCPSEPRASLGGRASLATLLDAAEARVDMDQACNSSSAAAGLRCDKKQGSFMDGLAEKEAENNSLAQQKLTGKPSALGALHSVVQRNGGRSLMNITLKQFSENPTSACVVAYLTRSLEDWKLDAAAVSRANGESTACGSSSVTALLAVSGVHLKFRVTMVESFFSLYFLRGEVAWSDAQTQMELCSLERTSTGVAEEQQLQQKSAPGASLSNAPWTVVVTTAIFRSTPIAVGEHVYLARPFFIFPTIRTIVASLNVTSDAVLQRLRPNPYKNEVCRTPQCHRRRPRDTESSDQQRHPVSISESRRARSTENFMNETTPERSCRSQALVSAASPFRAYDPFVNPTENLFRKNSVAAINFSSATASEAMAKLSQVHLQPQKTDSASVNAVVGAQAAVGDQMLEVFDTVGAGFPRGPGDEWDVPLEVLLALLPSRSESPSDMLEEETRAHCRGSLTVMPQRNVSGMSCPSSLSSID